MENKQPQEQEALHITIEEIKDEPTVIETTTVVDADLVHVLAKIAARLDSKNQQRRPLYNLLGVGIDVLALYWAYTWFITKTNTERGPAMIILLIIMSGILFWYVNQPLEQFMENRLKPFLGQEWQYAVTDEGVNVTLNGQSSVFEWQEIRGWWVEDGFYLMDVGGQSIALRQDSLEPEEEEALRSLLYIYLGKELPIQTPEGKKN